MLLNEFDEQNPKIYVAVVDDDSRVACLVRPAQKVNSSRRLALRSQAKLSEKAAKIQAVIDVIERQE